jgi:hypothetical protein
LLPATDGPDLEPHEQDELEEHGAVAADGEEPSPATMRIDLHCHSSISRDSSTPIALMPEQCRKQGIGVQAITDHHHISNAQALRDMVAQQEDPRGRDLTIIVGEEIWTSEGELIGLFLEEKIDGGLSPEETVARIHEQGGLVLLPHGFDPRKRSQLEPAARERIAADIDIVETFNTHVSSEEYNEAAFDWAQARDKAMSAGTDAHTLSEIGTAWVEVPRQPIRGPRDLLDALEHGVPTGEWKHPLIIKLQVVWDWIRRRIPRIWGPGTG